ADPQPARHHVLLGAAAGGPQGHGLAGVLQAAAGGGRGGGRAGRRLRRVRRGLRAPRAGRERAPHAPGRPQHQGLPEIPRRERARDPGRRTGPERRFLSKPLRIALAGLGTVGAGTLRLLRANADTIAARAGRELTVTAVCARNQGRDRGVDLSGLQWFDDPVALAREAEADVVVEVIGGSEGPAKAMVEAALRAGRHVVTANKALLAHHGTALAALAEGVGRTIGYEAAVAGGIPIIKGLREGL